MKIYKATIIPIVAGGSIEVRVSANSTSQAIGLIKTLPYFKSFVRQPVQEGNQDNHLTELRDLLKRANAKKQADLGQID